jgi:hypothetical protein
MRLISLMLIGSMCVLSTLTPMTARAGTCEQDIILCDKALQAKKGELRLCDLAVRQLQDENTVLKTQITDKDDALRAWYHNPFVLVALGLVIGVAATR